jgi:hypothetical protein
MGIKMKFKNVYFYIRKQIRQKRKGVRACNI